MQLVLQVEFFAVGFGLDIIKFNQFKPRGQDPANIFGQGVKIWADAAAPIKTPKRFIFKIEIFLKSYKIHYLLKKT